MFWRRLRRRIARQARRLWERILAPYRARKARIRAEVEALASMKLHERILAEVQAAREAASRPRSYFEKRTNSRKG
jgi:hypothetical protein